jgi:microcystin-dependent protein
MITEEIRNVIVRFGLTPDAGDLTQLHQAIMAGQHPVGSIYMSMDPTSPAILFGGTWAEIKDRVLVGAGGSYAAGATGGSATAQLTIANLPSHSHGAVIANAGGHSHTGTAQSAGDHTHTRGSMEITGSASSACGGWEGNWSSGALSLGPMGNQQDGGAGGDGDPIRVVSLDFKASKNWTGATSSNGSHTHTVTIDSAGAHTHAVTISATGAGTAFNTMPPYMAAYMWYRTA